MTESLPKIFIEWIAPAYPQAIKSKGWYAFMGFIVLIFVGYGLFSSDDYSWIISITFLILATVYYFFELKPKPLINISISDIGIQYAGELFPYSQLKSFWIINEPDIRSLHFRTYKGSQRELFILIPIEINVAKIRDYLLLQLPEEEGKKESFSDQLIRNLGL